MRRAQAPGKTWQTLARPGPYASRAAHSKTWPRSVQVRVSPQGKGKRGRRRTKNASAACAVPRKRSAAHSSCERALSAGIFVHYLVKSRGDSRVAVRCTGRWRLTGGSESANAKQKRGARDMQLIGRAARRRALSNALFRVDFGWNAA